MKLKQLDTVSAANIPQRLKLRDSFTGELIVDADEKTWDVFVYGAESDKARQAKREWAKKLKADLSEEEENQAAAEFLAAVIAGWSPNIVDDDGHPVEFNHQNAVELVKDNAGVAQQVSDFAKRTRNYDPKR